MLKRDRYLQKIAPFISKPVIKVITGMRRVGKSYFLRLIEKQLLDNGVEKKSIVFIDKENLDFEFIETYKDLHDFVKSKFKGKSLNGKKVLFIDEVQEITGWEKAIVSLNKTEEYDIYITGSNANLLSSELATLIAGRYIEMQIYPLAYSEFVEFTGKNFTNHEDCFDKYTRYGGLPGIFHIEQTDETVYQYLSAIYNTILLKDIIKKHNIRNVSLLENISKFIFDNIGNLITANNISKYLKSQKIKCSGDTVLTYIGYFLSTYTIHKAMRFDIKGKKLLEINEKYFVNDLGIRHSILNYKQNDIAQILENIVYMELKFRGYSVLIGKQDTKEIDFIATKENEKIYIQVSYLLSTEETIKREFSPLQEIKDNYPKMALSMDKKIWGTDYLGIQRKNIIDFLNENLITSLSEK